jgi:hypothetical protein
MQNSSTATAALEIRSTTGSLVVQHSKPLETVEDAILWIRRESKALRAVGLSIESRRYTFDGGRNWFTA